MVQILNNDDFINAQKQEMIMFYFSHEACGVCQVLMPKIKNMIELQFKKMPFQYIDIKSVPELAGQHCIFTVPTILMFVDGKEYYRVSRNVALNTLKSAIQKPYEMIFEV